MKHTIRIASLLAVIGASLISTVPAHAFNDDAQTTVGNETCCFTNPRYTGECKVTTGPDESCSDVLAYLNNQASVGKTYCGNTKVRGGWTQVDCEGSEATCTPSQPTDDNASD